MPLITLTTDFGLADSYVAEMKGVILGINPAATIVDVSHAVPPQDVRRAAFLLNQAAEAFPAGTTHVAVVDPGVGSERGLVGLETDGKRYVAPDNGVLTLVAQNRRDFSVHLLTESKFWRRPVSRTFHGRDIMGPVAAQWSLGADLAEFGPPLATPLVTFPFHAPRLLGRSIVGQVLFADSFGNLSTNIPESLLPERDRSGYVVEAGRTRVRGISGCYADKAAGELVALIGSAGRLELAVNGGSAALELNLPEDSQVRVTWP